MADRPPIPATCASRPTIGGLVVPYVNVRLRDGGVDFRSADNQRYEQVWRHTLCQTCGGRLGDLAVFFGGTRQVTNGRFDEPHVCPPCAVYVSRACPMVAGRRAAYAHGPKLADGHRGQMCGDTGCECMGWVETVKGDQGGGAPAHPWYAVYVRTGGWVLTGEEQTLTVEGQQVTRTVINGGLLTVAPLKVILVSEPGRGRVWERTTMPEQAPDACTRDKPPKENTCPVSAS